MAVVSRARTFVPQDPEITRSLVSSSGNIREIVVCLVRVSRMVAIKDQTYLGRRSVMDVHAAGIPVSKVREEEEVVSISPAVLTAVRTKVSVVQTVKGS